MTGEEYQLNIDDHVPFVDPTKFGATDIKGIKPKMYFVTSGDAVEKAKVLEADLWTLAGKIKTIYGKSADERHQKLIKAIWSAAGKARAMLQHLKKVRGDAIFLETETRNHILYCIPKNPRIKDSLDSD
jgi:hypothetical protein